MPVGAFDIDGTIMHHQGRVEYLNVDSLSKAKPDLHVCRRIRALISAGLEIHFITGRCHPVKNFTVKQLQAFVHQGIQDTQVHTQEVFDGYGAMAAWKGSRLKAIKAEWYVGDHNADYEASQIAGIPFQHAEAYSRASRDYEVLP